MATIKDIAKRAGVSHATVSNVLNRKGNVSAKRIKLVMDAAEEMGYHVNQAAASLRSGTALIMAVVMPDISGPAHRDLYVALSKTARENGYSVDLHLTGNVPEQERLCAQAVLSSRAQSVVTVTCLEQVDDCYAPLKKAGIRVVFALRGEQKGYEYAGFHLAKAAEELLRGIRADGVPTGLVLMRDMGSQPAQEEFASVLAREAEMRRIPIKTYKSVSAQYMKQAFSVLADEHADAVVTTSVDMADAVLTAAGKLGRRPRVYTLAPQRTVRRKDLTELWLDYRSLGSDIARRLTGAAPPEAPLEGCIVGLAAKAPTPRAHPARILMLTADTPAAHALRQLLPCLEKETRVHLDMDILPTREVYRALETPGALQKYDLARIDLRFMDERARRELTPLHDFDELDGLVPGVLEEYGMAGGALCALPFDPGCHILFYRSDIISNSHYRRRFFEKYKTELTQPRTCDDFLRAAEFFDAVGREEGQKWRGGIITGKVGESISTLAALSRDGSWPRLSPEELREYADRRIRLAQCTLTSDGGSWNTAVSRFAAGDGALLIAHSNYARHLSDHPLSAAAGRVRFAKAPGARAFLGGGSLGIVRGSRRKSAALDVLHWLCRPETVDLMALLSGCSAWERVYHRQELSDIYPWLDTVHDGLVSGVRRSLFPNARNGAHTEMEIARVLDGLLKNTVGAREAADAINRLAADK